MKLLKTITRGYLKESESGRVFLGYHSTEKNMEDGEYKARILKSSRYSDIVRDAYMTIISDYDENLENDDVEAMNDVFEDLGYGFTFVSNSPIEATSYQSTKYKYGNYLYKVYGDGYETLLDDVNELNATIVVTDRPLYFERV